MGVFSVPLRVWSVDRGRHLTVEAMVDTGSSFTTIPAAMLRDLGYAPYRTSRLRLANGEIVEFPAGTALFSVESAVGQWVDGSAKVIFGAEGQFLLGATTLEDMELGVDPVAGALIHVPGYA